MTRETFSYIHFAFVDDVEVLSFLALLNDHITGEMNFRKHCIKDLCSFILIQMAIEKKRQTSSSSLHSRIALPEENILFDRFGKCTHGGVVFLYNFTNERRVSIDSGR